MAKKRLPPKEYHALIMDVFKRDGWTCRVPGCYSRSNLHAHHLKFRSQGGLDILSNLITVCSTCHDKIHRSTDGKVTVTPIGDEFDANDKLTFTIQRRNNVITICN